MTTPFIAVIPARFAGTRLPGKALLDIGGKPLLQHAYESAVGSAALRTMIATDDGRIRDAARDFGADVVMTGSGHRSGTDRIAEVIRNERIAADTIIVNVQGDEFGLPPLLADQVADNLAAAPDAAMATLCVVCSTAAEIDDPNTVKVVFDKDHYALYFSRSRIPSAVDAEHYRHIGIYAYRAGFVAAMAAMPACPLELAEKLEQIRALYYGYRIHVEPACEPPGHGINTPRDLENARCATR